MARNQRVFITLLPDRPTPPRLGKSRLLDGGQALTLEVHAYVQGHQTKLCL
jgi:hypothetical protein